MDRLFATAKLRGAATDPGEVDVLIGPQTTIKRGGSQGGSGVYDWKMERMVGTDYATYSIA